MPKLKTVYITVKLIGYYCNEWPCLKILLNNNILFDGEIVDTVTLNFKAEELSSNQLKFVHYGKRFGENNIWDVTESSDRLIVLKDVLLNDVSIGSDTIHKLKFYTDWSSKQLSDSDAEFIKKYSIIDYSTGRMPFNGSINLNFCTPVYNWIIDQRFKKSHVGSNAYFSNFSDNWHYDKDIKLIEEIKELMKFK